MSLCAGDLRDRVIVEQQINSLNSAGEQVQEWEEVTFSARGDGKFWANISYISAREFVTSQQVKSSVVARIIMRFNANLLPSMRIRSGTTIFNIQGIQPDPETGREWMTIPAVAGLNAG